MRRAETGSEIDALFPEPASPAGKVLAHLVTQQIPGTAVEESRDALARATGLAPNAVEGALAHLSERGLILQESAPHAPQLAVTVLVAPPLEEFGITPQWGDGAERSGTNARSGQERKRAPEVSRQTQQEAARPRVAAKTTPAAPPRHEEGSDGARTRDTAGGASGQRRRTAPAAAPGTARAEAARGAESGVSLDETAMVRGFVERFEKLLGEYEALKRQAQQAEQRAAAAERLLQAAERRAETAEAKFAATQEKLRSWTELSRRMQQLSRQADAAGRGRVSRQSTAPAPTGAKTETPVAKKSGSANAAAG